MVSAPIGAQIHLQTHTHDVGVDAIGYVPLRLDQLLALMAELPELAFRHGTVVEAD